jgi:hypothetical protein
MTQYEKIIHNNLQIIFQHPSQALVSHIKAIKSNGNYEFNAFGQTCHLSTDGIFLGSERQTGPLGIILSLYAKHAVPDECIIEPLNAFKSFPNTAPYVGAFTSHTEQVLIPHVEAIEARRSHIYEKFDGCDAPQSLGGDFSFYVWPLPKIMLCYIFYRADDDFPASATCLFSNNASQFLPNDALADTGEYMSKSIIADL